MKTSRCEKCGGSGNVVVEPDSDMPVMLRMAHGMDARVKALDRRVTCQACNGEGRVPAPSPKPTRSTDAVQ